MPKQKVNEDFVITQAIKAFRSKSYHNTSMQDIAEACGLLKGSLYHYFPSKEALMTKVIEQMHRYFKEQVWVFAYDKSLEPKERLDRMAEIAEKVFFGKESGCIMGNIGMETAHIIPEFSEPIRQFFKDYIKALQTVFEEKYPKSQARELAERSVSEIEGAVMMTRIFDDKSFLTKTHKRINHRMNGIEVKSPSARLVKK